MLAPSSQPESTSAPLIGGLTVLAIAAIAMALPPSPITTPEGSQGLGILQSVGLFSAGMAEQNAVNDYGYLALDITAAHPDRQHSGTKNGSPGITQRFNSARKCPTKALRSPCGRQ